VMSRVSGDGCLSHLTGSKCQQGLTWRYSGMLMPMVGSLLTVTFACGVLIAIAHVVNQRFVAPVYDVVANLVAFGSAVWASLLLGHPVPAVLSSLAIVCWILLARRTFRERRGERRRSPR